MKLLIASLLAVLLVATTRAASDADFTIVRAAKVTIEENTVTIIGEAFAFILLISDDHIPDYKGQEWHGMPVTRVKVRTDNNVSLVIKRPAHGPEEGWQMTLKAAKELQDGKEVGRIGYYAPDMTIKGNVLAAVTGAGYLYPKGK